MSNISGYYGLDYSSLFTGASSQSGSSSLYSLLQTTGASSYSNYGVNSSTLTASQASSVLTYKSAAQTLQSALSSLMNKKNDGGSVFGGYEATSSDADSLTATYSNDVGKYSSEALLARRDPSYRPGAPEDVSVRVMQLATAQKNTSAALQTDGMDFEAGKSYSFELSDGDTTTKISFSVENGDTNESVLKKISSAINDKSAGVKASVITNEFTGESSLSLEARDTGIKDGAAASFELRDVSGDTVSSLGLNNITQQAQNAQYYVKSANGEIDYRESASNDVKLTDRLTATFKKTSEDYVDIGFKRDTKDGVNAVREMVNGFNALYDAASSGSTTQSARLATQLQGLADTYGKSLEAVGITRNSDGYFVINEDKMKTAAESGALENLFSSDDKSTNYGFAARLQNIASSAADNPYQYATGGTAKDDGDSSSRYAAFMEELNSGTSGSYSKLYFNLQRYENMGALFNSMF